MGRTYDKKPKKEAGDPQEGHSSKQTEKARDDPRKELLGLQEKAGNQALEESVGDNITQSAPPNELPDHVREVIRSTGQPLDPDTQAEMEDKFGKDFGGVRVHSDSEANESVKTEKAKAYTVGEDIVIGDSHYTPETKAGKELLGHELAHVVQQGRGGSQPVLDPSAPHEQDARSAGTASVAGQTSINVQGATGLGIARDEDEPLTPAHAGGEMGERDAAFELGKRGFEIIIGPGGKGGHKLTTAGIDIVAHDPKTGKLLIVDNKASGGTSTVQDASAITKNLEKNLRRAIKQVKYMGKFPNKDAVLSKLNSTLSAVSAGKKIPANVDLVVTNAGGFHSGVSKKLKDIGIKFEDITGKDVREARKKDIKKAKSKGDKPGRPVTHADKEEKPKSTAGKRTTSRKKAANKANVSSRVSTKHSKNPDFQTSGKVIHTDRFGVRSSSRGQAKVRGTTSTKFRPKGAGLAQFLPAAMNAIQDRVIRHRIASDMLGDWSKIEGWRRKHPNDVIIAAVSLQEWEHPDPTGQVARAVNYVRFYHGPTRQAAETKANKVLRSGVPKGWREVGLFIGYIEPSDDLDELKEHVEDQEGCFIATTCYGSPLAQEVVLLQEYRDKVLRHRWAGRLIIELYYAMSPPIARFLQRHSHARHFVRTVILTPIIFLVNRSAKYWSVST